MILFSVSENINILLVDLLFSLTEEVISQVPARFELYGTSDGWECCIGS